MSSFFSDRTTTNVVGWIIHRAGGGGKTRYFARVKTKDNIFVQALDKLVMVEADNENALRSKRTIGILRQLFPEISEVNIDKIQTTSVGNYCRLFFMTSRRASERQVLIQTDIQGIYIWTRRTYSNVNSFDTNFNNYYLGTTRLGLISLPSSN